MWTDPEYQRLEREHDAARIDLFIALYEAGVWRPYTKAQAEGFDFE